MSNPESRSERGLEELATAALLRRLHSGDREVAAAVGRALPALGRAVEAALPRWRAGGRLIYAGAGTSGRLAALDAAELRPTFGIAAGRTRVLMAGGAGALRRAREGAEDDRAAARRDLARLKPQARDIVIGVAASGATPYTLAVVKAARRAGCLTLGLQCTPGAPLGRAAAMPIELATGPEAITGSTRLKAGSAQKMALNLFSNALLIRAGLVYGRRMVAVRASNAKLRRRALGIVTEAAPASAARARAALADAGGDARLAILLARGVPGATARRHLRQAQGSLRAAERRT